MKSLHFLYLWKFFIKKIINIQRSVIFSIFIGFPFSSSAVISYQGNYITDYDNGRDFLNLSITQGHSIDEVFENIRAGSGWSVASIYMIEELVYSAGVLPRGSTSSRSEDPRNFNAMKPLIFNMGETLSALPFSYSASIGFAQGSPFGAAALTAQILSDGSYYVTAGKIGASFYRDEKRPEFGVWLTRDCNCYFDAFNETGEFKGFEFIPNRPVLELSSVFSKPLSAIPEPQTYIMFSIGILLLGGAYHRRKNHDQTRMALS
jgi:hypothetical protein